MTADQLLLGVLHDARGRRIHVCEPAFCVAVVDQILRVLHDVAQALFADAQRLLGEAAVRHVAVVDDDGGNRGIVEAVHRDGFEASPRSVLVAYAVLGRQRHARALQALDERVARPLRPIRSSREYPRSRADESLAKRIVPSASSMATASGLFWTRTWKSGSIQSCCAV